MAVNDSRQRRRKDVGKRKTLGRDFVVKCRGIFIVGMNIFKKTKRRDFHVALKSAS